MLAETHSRALISEMHLKLTKPGAPQPHMSPSPVTGYGYGGMVTSSSVSPGRSYAAVAASPSPARYSLFPN